MAEAANATVSKARRELAELQEHARDPEADATRRGSSRRTPDDGEGGGPQIARWGVKSTTSLHHRRWKA